MRLTYAMFYLLCSVVSYQAVADSKAVIGWVEYASLHNRNISLKAKMDTGADNTSLHASNLKLISKKGEDWVRFELPDEVGGTHTIEQPVIRYTSIKRRGVSAQERPVILLKICVSNQLREVEVNLTDRSNYSYKLLIGRSYMEGLFLIDSASMYTVSPDCK